MAIRARDLWAIINKLDVDLVADANKSYLQSHYPGQYQKLLAQDNRLMSPSVKNIVKSEYIYPNRVIKDSAGEIDYVLTPKGEEFVAQLGEGRNSIDVVNAELLNKIKAGAFPKESQYSHTVHGSNLTQDVLYQVDIQNQINQEAINNNINAVKNQVVAEEAARAKAVQDMQTQLDAVNTAKTQLIDGVPNLVTLGVTAAAPVGVVSLFGSDQEPAPYLPKYPPPPQNPYYRGSYY